jgi:hypothetical protein
LLISSVFLAACSEDEGSPDPDPGWVVVQQELPGALICVSGTGDDDVWASGGDPGDGTGPFVLHYDGSSWTRLPTGTTGDLWWVHAFPSGPVFLGGSQGTILRYQAGTFTPMTTPGTDTVFGIWGASPDDLWAVGGNPQVPGSAFVWRSDGETWTAAAIPSLPISAYFKVWGRNASDVRIVGNDGVILRYDGVAIVDEPSATNRKLLTIHVDGDGPWVAVGGVSQAVILEQAGGWQDVSPSAPSQPLFGVRMSGNDGYAVGTGASVLRRNSGVWSEEKLGFEVFGDLHSAWISPSGRVWLAGGDLLAVPLVNGVLLHKGKAVKGGGYD